MLVSMKECVKIEAMEKRNYQKEMERIISSFEGKKKSLLLHSCCGPCSSYVLEYLREFFDITVLFYNPNIYPREEFQKRFEEEKKLIDAAFPDVKLKEIGYDENEFFEAVKGFEHLGENSARCYKCYEFRMRKAALLSKDFDYFTTTLSISPYKNAEWINELGFKLEKEFGVKYLPADFKKKGGYQRSIELCKIYDIYRQHYCGCKFSLEESIDN